MLYNQVCLLLAKIHYMSCSLPFFRYLCEGNLCQGMLLLPAHRPIPEQVLIARVLKGAEDQS